MDMTDLNQKVEAEILRRVRKEASRTYFAADYYRIRRKLAFPLPVSVMPPADMQVGDLKTYPWGTWIVWNLEQRVEALGWAAEWGLSEGAKSLAAADLEGVCNWSTYRQYPNPDLVLAHSARMLSTPYTNWTWLEPALREKLTAALTRLLADSLPVAREFYKDHNTKEKIFAAEEPKVYVHNIPLLGTLGLAIAAHAVGDVPAVRELDGLLHEIVGALFDLFVQGVSEGVSYDGHVFSFVVDWLDCLPENERRPYVDHPQWETLLDETCLIGAPGNVHKAAPLSDVEAEKMRLPASAQVKAFRAKPSPRRAWFVSQMDLEQLPVEGLVSLKALAGDLERVQPEFPAVDQVLRATYLRVLRTGWEPHDVCVAVAASNTPFAHVHPNNGTLTIGHDGEWLIQSPGYQQYMQNSEREFTNGPTSRNTPVINGAGTTIKSLVAHEPSEELALDLDLTGCYAPDLGIRAVQRMVSLEGKVIQVEDQIETAEPATIEYFWHGHPDAAWWIENNVATLRLDHRSLRISSPDVEFTFADLHRLKGSRGHLTLAVKTTGVRRIRWKFEVG